MSGPLAALLAAGDLPGRIDAWVALVHWLRESPDQRIGEVAAAMAADPALRGQVLDVVQAILAESDATNMFGVSGIPQGRGFLSEAWDRLLNLVLPRPRDDHEMSRLLHRLYEDREAVGTLTPAVFAAAARLLDAPERPLMWQPLRRSFADGFRLLAARIAAHGAEAKLRERMTRSRVADSVFVRQQRLAETLIAAWESGQPVATAGEAWRAEVESCRVEMVVIHRRLTAEGVSVDIVFAVDVIERSLARMELMAAVILTPPGEERTAASHRLLVSLVDSLHGDQSVVELARADLGLLHRQIVDRSGTTGDHYIAGSSGEYRHIWLASMGGGILTIGTAAVKTGLHQLAHAIHLAWGATGFLFGINYAVSFVAMQHLGLMLATKQPAMTAAALAGLLRDHQGDDRIDSVVDRAAAICASQLAAAGGNLLMVASGCLAFDTLWRLTTGRHWIPPEEVVPMCASLSPLHSGTVFYAAFTGVVLWLSSLAGGWFDNFSAYHRLPQGIAEHRLGGGIIGRGRMLRLGAFWREHAAGWGTNISLGFMLGMTPAFGNFIGIPLDVRHVTLNSGIFALAVSGGGSLWLHPVFYWALAGIACMFVLNLGVSFGLSLFTAVRALGLPVTDLLLVGRGLAWRILTRPHQFVLPPAGGGHPHH